MTKQAQLKPEAIIIPKWLAVRGALRVPSATMLKAVLALVHVQRTRGAAEVVIAPETLAMLCGVTKKTLKTRLIEGDFDACKYVLRGIEHPIISDFGELEWPHPNPYRNVKNLLKWKFTIDPGMTALFAALPGEVRIPLEEFIRYENRASLMMRMRIGAIALKKVFNFAVLKTEVEWATGARYGLSHALASTFDPALDEINAYCGDFQIVSNRARRRGTNPKAHIARVDFRVELLRSRTKLENGTVAWLLPESYEGRQPKITRPPTPAIQPAAPPTSGPRMRRLRPMPLPVVDQEQPELPLQ